jgi:TolB-like protein/Tfp pilus assembly protein PilF
MSFFSELKRRNVMRVAVLYGVASWVLLQVGDLLFGALGVPAWGIRLLLGLLLLGFPLTLIFAWVYELTPEGLKREHEVTPDASVTAQTAKRLDLLVIVLLVAAICLVAADRFLGRGPPAPSKIATVQYSVPGPAGAQASSSTVSIAVLPFVNMSDDKSNEYFSDGLTEELLNVLANVPGMRVIARTSSFAYKGKEVKISDVAHDLNVDNVLEGSVRKAGNRVRITTQLIRASDSSHLWSETYDRDLNDIFKVQDEISGEVVDALKVRLLKGAESQSEVGGTRLAGAYEAYLRGRFERNKGNAEPTLRAALAAFDQAIALDGGYARAHAARGTVLYWMASNGYLPFGTGFAQARQAAQHAIELTPDLADPYLTLGDVALVVDMDLVAAGKAVERALALDPGSTDVQDAYSTYMSSIGQHDRAIAAAEKAVELDPLSAGEHSNLSSRLWAARQYDKAEVVARRALSLEPDRPDLHNTLGFALLMLHRPDEALAEFNRESIHWERLTGRALAFAMSGKPALANVELAEMQRTEGEASSYQYAEINAALGDRDESLRWLETARRIRDPGLMTNVFSDPFLDPLRDDPRFTKLLRELGFPVKS